jgi:hypothetical protein
LRIACSSAAASAVPVVASVRGAVSLTRPTATVGGPLTRFCVMAAGPGDVLLIAGPYETLRGIRVGDRLTDLARGEVVVGGFATAPVPWPYARALRGRGAIVFYGDLVVHPATVLTPGATATPGRRRGR